MGVLTLMTNPKKRKRRAKARRRNPFHGKARSRRRNPIYRAKVYRRRRRNPSFAVAGYKPVDLLKLGASAAAGAVAARAITQVALKDKNQGLMGYGANILVSIALGYFGSKLSQEVGVGLLAGGLGSTMQRIWDERVSNVSPAAQPQLSGLGDASYSDNGLGEYVNADWYQPTFMGPAAPAAGVPTPAPAGAPKLAGRGW